LEQRPLLLEAEEESGERARPDVEALRLLVEEVERDGSAFQSVAVAAVQIIERALLYEREAAEAALSLGQQEKLTSMVQTAEEAAEVLRGTLSAQGAKVMHLCSKENPPQPTSTEDASGSPWWFALTDALEVLEEGTGRMSSLTTAQPEGSPACRLSRCITELLRSHHDALLLEADEWIS
jgi:hypothetical protein